jgi:hypothetical protein
VAKVKPIPETFETAHFPRCGIDVSLAFGKQPVRPMPDGTYAKTTPLGLNCRTFEPLTNRARGATRPGLVRYIPAQPAGSNLIQLLQTVVGTGYANPGGGVPEQSNSGRVVTLVAVSQGNVFVAASGSTAWVPTINATAFSPPLNANGIVYSAANIQQLWFADGSNWCVYTPSTNTVSTWAATQGELPVDSAGNTPRLIATWRGRTILSGLLFDPQSVFMSAVGDPTNWNYSPLSTTATQAVALTVGQQGFVGDVVTALVPYTDDVMLIGTDHELHLINGDPMAGGQIDLLSDKIGMAWGVAYTKDPYGSIYFVSNRTGIYTLTPGSGPPTRISQPIEQLLQSIDTGANTITLLWNDQFQGLHVFVTTTGTNSVNTHFFWEQRANAWWTDQFASTNFNPLCCTIFDGNSPGDRTALIGSWDGYVRSFNATATNDDSFAFTSSVIIGPILTKDLDEMLLKDIQAVLATGSGTVQYEILVGATPELALTRAPVASGTWGPGRNLTNHVRHSGHAIYIKISSTNQWAIESVRARIAQTGKVRRRGR